MKAAELHGWFEKRIAEVDVAKLIAERILDDFKYGDVFPEPMVKGGSVPPGTMVRYLTVEGIELLGLVVAQQPPPTKGAMPIHLVVWSNGSMSQHVYCTLAF